MEKFTPGPWRYGEDQVGTKRVFSGDYEIVRALSTHGYGNRLSREERDANATLIAAAPELVEALKPFARIAEIMGEAPPIGTGDTLHSWELMGGSAALRFSDCKRALELLRKAGISP